VLLIIDASFENDLTGLRRTEFGIFGFYYRVARK